MERRSIWIIAALVSFIGFIVSLAMSLQSEIQPVNRQPEHLQKMRDAKAKKAVDQRKPEQPDNVISSNNTPPDATKKKANT